MMDGYQNDTVGAAAAIDDHVMALLAESVACSGRKVVTAASPVATGAGLTMFARGGNAFDAALACAFMEAVALPMKCGLGGDLIALVIENGHVEALISIGPGIAALSEGAPPELVGPTAIGIPGAPAGYAALAERGRLPLTEVLQPAIDAAEAGVRWSRIAVALTQESEVLLRKYNGPNAFLPGGRLPQIGETFVLPGLAGLLRRYGEVGAALFQGEEGERLVARIRRAGGHMTHGDLQQNPARWQEAASLKVGRDIVWATPSPTYGEFLLHSVQAASERGIDAIAAARLAREELRRRQREASDSGTSVVTAADDEGRSVVIVHSNSFPTYGSGVLMEDWDLVLNNRPGRGFSTNVPPTAANAPKAGRVPFTTLNAWAVRRGDRLYTGGTPGGINQSVWNLQTVLECLDSREPGEIVTAPRFSLDASDMASLEANHSSARSGEHKVVSILSNRSASQVILRHLDSGLLVAAADPRMGARAAALQ